MYNSSETSTRIRQLAKEKGIQMSELQEKCGLSKNTIMQSGKSQEGMKAKNLYAIAEMLECSIDYLLGRTDNPNITSETYNNGDNGIQNVKNGTVNINQSDEMTKEISLLLSDLTYRQKTDLMKQIYDFVDETKREGE